MYKVEAYKQECYCEDVYNQQMILPTYEDTKLTFRDVSYDEEVAKPYIRMHMWYCNLLMRNTSNSVAHPTKCKNKFRKTYLLVQLR